MESQWMSEPDAASAMSLTVRTVKQWVASGRLNSRLENGRCLVLVNLDRMSVKKMKASPVAEYDRPSLNSSDQFIDIAPSLFEESQAAARRTRISSYLGWSMAVLLTIGYGVGVWWTTKAVTTAEVSAHRMAERADILTNQAIQLATDLDRQRQQTDRERERADKERERADVARLTTDDLYQQLLAARSELAQAHRQEIEADIAAMGAVSSGNGRNERAQNRKRATRDTPSMHVGG